MASLQDQLLKAGIIDSKKAKKIQKQKHKQNKQQLKQAPKGQKVVTETQLQAQKTLANKAQRDRELNRQQQEAAEVKAITAQIKQLIQTHRINRDNGEVAYQFTHNKKIKKLYVTPKLQSQLSRGFIAIVVFNTGFELVPSVVAEKIRLRDESSVVLLNTHSSSTDQVDEDDPYADFKIPDDLMW